MEGSAQSAQTVVRRYFDAVEAKDVEAMCACWAEGGVENIVPVGEMGAPEGVREYFTTLFAAFPDFDLETLAMVGEGDRVAVHWHATGTLAGAPFQGLEPNGGTIDLTGIDLLTVENGEIVRNDAHFDAAALARQLGAMPPEGSGPERALKGALNARTRIAGSLLGPRVEDVAEGVWVVKGGIPRNMNVYLLADDGGVTMFDAGISDMTRSLGAICARFGGLRRIVLGHAHQDHRGAAPGLAERFGVPVLCHAEEVADAEGDGGFHTFDLSKIQRGPVRWAYPHLLSHWDGGPVKISGTVAEGDEVAGFQVMHIPGHAKGLIALWRDSDRLALVSDGFYTLDPESGKRGDARVPHPAFTPDREQARESIRKIAALEPAAAWPGHALPVMGDVRGALEHAAATT